MAYTYGRSTKVKRVRAIGPTSRELEARMAKYVLPPGPRGDTPSGQYNAKRPAGRTGDMRYGYQNTPQGQAQMKAADRYRRGRSIPAWRREAYRTA